jgi:hypothetical protein
MSAGVSEAREIEGTDDILARPDAAHYRASFVSQFGGDAAGTSLTPNRHSLTLRLSLFGHELSGLLQLGWHIHLPAPASWEYNLCRDSFFIST